MVEDDGEAYGEIDSFLNSLEVSKVLSKAIGDPVTSKATATTKSTSSKSASSKVMSESSDGVKTKKKVVSESTTAEIPTADMTVSQLKDRCRSKGLPVGGTKAELLSRLTER